MAKIFLGSHVGFKSKDYLAGSVNEIISYKGNCFMVFTGPPQNFIRKEIDKENVNLAHQLMKENNVENLIVVHAPYLINLASPKKGTRELGLDKLIIEVNRTYQIGSKLIVLHPGSCLDGNRQKCIELVSFGLNQAINKTNNDVIICVETMAGKGSEVGINFDEIAQIIQGVKDKERIGVCLDTCHIHEAGYDVSKIDDILNEFDQKIGLKYLKVIHLNDSKNESGARKDRHENIGYGKIGFKTLLEWVHHPLLENVPKILETPYKNDVPVYQQEIKNLLTKKWEDF